jgi:hypothetical protein
MRPCHSEPPPFFLHRPPRPNTPRCPHRCRTRLGKPCAYRFVPQTLCPCSRAAVSEGQRVVAEINCVPESCGRPSRVPSRLPASPVVFRQALLYCACVPENGILLCLAAAAISHRPRAEAQAAETTTNELSTRSEQRWESSKRMAHSPSTASCRLSTYTRCENLHLCVHLSRAPPILLSSSKVISHH